MNFIKKIKRKIMEKFTSQVKYAKSIGVTVGNNCKFYENITWGSEPYLINIGDNVRITKNVTFITHDGGVHVIRKVKNKPNIDRFGQIKIGNNVHIGIGTIIMPNVTIGDNCVIGCGAVVTKNVPSNSVAVGVPARVIETIDEYYEKNKSCFYDTKNMNSKQKKEFLKSIYKF